MKKLTLILSLCLIISAGKSIAQESAVKFNPLAALFGNISLAYEKAFTENVSAQLNLGFLSRSISGSSGISSIEYKYSGFQISPEGRYYLDQVMEGWYAGVFLNFNSVTQKVEYTDGSSEDYKTSITNIGGGIEFGKQWLLGANDNFVIDLNLGAGYQSASIKDDEGDDIEFSLAADGIWPKLGFSLGIVLQ